MSEDITIVSGDPAGAWPGVLTDIAHDVRGAAGGAALWLELVSRARDDAAREKAIHELGRALAQSVRLADDLADGACLLEGGEFAARMPFDLGAALAHSRDRLAADAESRHLALEVQTAPGFVHPMVGDEKAFGRTLDRILSAAIAQSTGATLTLRLGPAAAGGAELAVPCGSLSVPPELPLFEAWGRPRPPGTSFPFGLWLARGFLARTGGRLETREEERGRVLVAFIP